MQSITLDLDGKHREKAYTILAGLITPRPIAWVTTLNKNGTVNAAPFSFFNCFGSKPPLVVFAPGNRDTETPKDTAINIKREGEWVIHMVDHSVMHAMKDSAASMPYGESEINTTELTLGDCEKITTPRIVEAPVALECSKHSILEIGSNRLVIGIVHRVHVREGLIDPSTCHLDPEKYQPIGRMASPDWYCKTSSLFELQRPGRFN